MEAPKPVNTTKIRAFATGPKPISGSGVTVGNIVWDEIIKKAKIMPMTKLAATGTKRTGLAWKGVSACS